MLIPIKINKDDVIQITANHGGYIGATCLACHQSGWLIGKYGFKHDAINTMGNQLIHTKECEMNKYSLNKYKP